jgi:2-C-methyl-D-erythritol 2,4-cyclodiphosphate synthase
MAERIIRIGCGFDAHRFSDDRKLVLGGVPIEHPRGLAGHSDADVVLHALCDALLGATAMGDIGQHFPADSDEFKDIPSLILLERVAMIVRQDKWKFVNADITVICESPKIAPYAERMRQNIAAMFDAPLDTVSVKGTTTEKMGFTGREEGIAAMAVVLVSR